MKYKLILLMILLTAISAIAQTPKFKKGDHIEFSQNSACLGDQFAVQSMGTIVDITPGGSYAIELDARSGGSPVIRTVPIYYEKCGIRLAEKNQKDAEKGGATEKVNTQTTKINNAAGEGSAKFKEGDRVEVETVHAGFDSQFARVAKGTILQVETGTAMRYVIQLDPLPGKTPVIHTMPIYDQDTCLRPLAGVAPKILTEKLRVDENKTVLADRELLDCDNLKHTGKNGTPLPVDLAKKLIRCLYEHPSPVAQDGATTMDITEFTIGAPHRWNRNEDMGQGNASTLVYPVHVKWNMKTFYRSRNVETTNTEMMFTCFADTTNLWQCGGAAGPHKDGKVQEIVVKE